MRSLAASPTRSSRASSQLARRGVEPLRQPQDRDHQRLPPVLAVQHTAHSNHNIGKAIDFRVLGVPNEVVRDYCRDAARRRLRATTRTARSCTWTSATSRTFWIDYSRPGEPPRYNAPNLDADEGTSDVGEEAHLAPPGENETTPSDRTDRADDPTGALPSTGSEGAIERHPRRPRARTPVGTTTTTPSASPTAAPAPPLPRARWPPPSSPRRLSPRPRVLATLSATRDPSPLRSGTRAASSAPRSRTVSLHRPSARGGAASRRVEEAIDAGPPVETRRRACTRRRRAPPPGARRPRTSRVRRRPVRPR